MRRSNIFEIDALDDTRPLEIDLCNAYMLTKELLVKNSKNPNREEELTKYIYGRPREYTASLLYVLLSNPKTASDVFATGTRHLKASMNHLESAIESLIQVIFEERLIISNDHLDFLAMLLNDKCKVKLKNITSQFSNQRINMPEDLLMTSKKSHSHIKANFQSTRKSQFSSNELIPFPFSSYDSILQMDTRGFRYHREMMKSRFHLSEYLYYNNNDEFLIPLFAAQYLFLDERWAETKEIHPILEIYKGIRNGGNAAAFISIVTSFVLNLLKTNEFSIIMEEILKFDLQIFLHSLEYLLTAFSMCPRLAQLYFFNNIQGAFSNISGLERDVLSKCNFIDNNLRYFIHLLLSKPNIPQLTVTHKQTKSENRKTEELYLELSSFKKSLTSSIP